MELVLDAFAPALSPNDDRGWRAVQAIEAAWHAQLLYDFDDQYNLVRIDRDRASYLVPNERGHLPFLTTGEGEPDATFKALLHPEELAPGGVATLHVHATLPMLSAADAASGLEHVAEALRADWAMLTPDDAHTVIVEQVVGKDGDESPPAGLPALDLPEDLPCDVPQRLGWINYWSFSIAARSGFGDQDSALARETPTGWIVQLTPEPLDLKRADHLAALRSAYERWPAIGRNP